VKIHLVLDSSFLTYSLPTVTTKTPTNVGNYMIRYNMIREIYVAQKLSGWPA